MKTASVVLVLTILGLVTLSSAAVMQLADSDNDGIIESPVSGIVTGTQDLNEIAQGAGAAAWYELLVQAEGHEASVDPGDFETTANILVLVTYMGAPVDMLTEDHFDLKTWFVAPGYGELRVESFRNYGNGAYRFEVVPTEGITWGAGEYVIQLSVSVPGIAGGQTIASIEVT